jgi:hypothetical protein
MTSTLRRPQNLQLLVLGLGVAVAALVVVWLLVSGGGSKQTGTPDDVPTIVSQGQLERFAGTLDYPVYWAGPKPGYSYELTAAHGRVWVRYLPAGVKAGDPRPNFPSSEPTSSPTRSPAYGARRSSRTASPSGSRTAASSSSTPRDRRASTSATRA